MSNDYNLNLNVLFYWSIRFGFRKILSIAHLLSKERLAMYRVINRYVVEWFERYLTQFIHITKWKCCLITSLYCLNTNDHNLKSNVPKGSDFESYWVWLIFFPKRSLPSLVFVIGIWWNDLKDACSIYLHLPLKMLFPFCSLSVA